MKVEDESEIGWTAGELVWWHSGKASSQCARSPCSGCPLAHTDCSQSERLREEHTRLRVGETAFYTLPASQRGLDNFSHEESVDPPSGQVQAGGPKHC